MSLMSPVHTPVKSGQVWDLLSTYLEPALHRRLEENSSEDAQPLGIRIFDKLGDRYCVGSEGRAGKMRGLTPRFLLCQIVGASLFAAAWLLGAPQYLYAGDPTYLTPAIASLAVVALLFAAAGRQQAADFISYELPVLGLLGTFVGLQMAVDATSGDFGAIRAALGTAFNTTIVGIIGAGWLRLTKQLA